MPWDNLDPFVENHVVYKLTSTVPQQKTKHSIAKLCCQQTQHSNPAYKHGPAGLRKTVATLNILQSTPRSLLSENRILKKI